ncbi:hypothetical protein Tcan_06348 [Toxocara canis]|uniref:Uncharacterized protein n=1 Tax=Toxocara canis TaxID=6265 RepID=A0A0B2VB86_TOXCA|nr:hypothetical protein Tcan_06348 [Toxocara canis]
MMANGIMLQSGDLICQIQHESSEAKCALKRTADNINRKAEIKSKQNPDGGSSSCNKHFPHSIPSLGDEIF